MSERGTTENTEVPRSRRRASLREVAPDVAQQWHPTRNGAWTPDVASRGSHVLAWWRCDEGHEWRASVVTRADGGARCPECVDQDTLTRLGGSIAQAHPELVERWDAEANGGLTADAVAIRSETIRSWRCPKCDATYRRRPSHHAADLRCPRCEGRARGPKARPLAQQYPGLVAMWDAERNGPAETTVASSRPSYWWRCDKGHSFQQRLHARLVYGAGCPVCSGRRVAAGVNDLATTHPDAAAHWHPTQNGELTARDVTSGSAKRVWWLCDEGHEWQAQVRSWLGGRTGYAGCPTCRDLDRSAANADAALRLSAYRLRRAHAAPGVKHPLPVGLADQWHPTRNDAAWPGGRETASRVSRRSAWWVCPCGHEWEEVVRRRAAKSEATVCPACATSWAEHGPRTPLEVARPAPHPLNDLVEAGLSFAYADWLAIVADLRDVASVRAAATWRRETLRMDGRGRDAVDAALAVLDARDGGRCDDS